MDGIIDDIVDRYHFFDGWNLTGQQNILIQALSYLDEEELIELREKVNED